MLNLGARFRVCNERVVARILDGEAVIIDLSSGVYYSLPHTGAVVWELIGAGYSVEEIETAIIEGHDVSSEQARADVRRLAGELLDEGLIVALDAATPAPASLPNRTVERLPYTPPALEVYRDVSDLLAIDPPMPTLPDLPWKESTDA